MSDTPTATTEIVRGEVVAEIEIAAPPTAVFPHLVEPDKILRWIGLDGELDVREGGAYHLGVTPDDRARGTFVEITPPTRVVFTWGWDSSEDVPPGSSTVTIELTPVADGTRVRLTHSGLPAPQTTPHGEGWRYYIARLGVAATGGDPGPEYLGSDDQTREAR